MHNSGNLLQATELYTETGSVIGHVNYSSIKLGKKKPKTKTKQKAEHGRWVARRRAGTPHPNLSEKSGCEDK